MKIKLFSTVFAIAILGALLSLAGSLHQADDPGVLLRAALEKEEVDGDLQGAIDLYKNIIAKYGDHRAIAAKAQLHIGLCFEKLGKAEAIKAYELVLKNYAGETDQVAVARARLAALKKEKPEGMSSTEITFEGEYFEALALSPDGTKIAGNAFTKGQNIAVYDLATKKMDLVTDFTYQAKEESGRWANLLAWSPDGEEIAYRTGRWQQVYSQELRVSTLDGKSRILYKSDKGSIVPFDWLADGSAILAVIVYQDDTPSALGLIPANGGEFKTIYSSEGIIFPSHLSPDNRFIVFASMPRDGTTGDINIIGTDGQSLEVLTDNPAADKEPQWSPDGKHIVFLSDRHGDWALWGIAVKSGKPEGHPFMIRTDMSDGKLCNWTPSGLLCWRMIHTKDIFVLPIDPESLEPQGKSRQIPFTPTGGNGCPVWSPDGKYLAFASRSKGAAGATSIVLLSADEEEIRQFKIPENYSTDVVNDLRWLPDSSGIGYSGFHDYTNPSLFRLTFANEEWKAWPIPIDWWTRVDWNVDGSAFLYARHGFNSDNPGIVEHNLETGKERYVYEADKNVGSIRDLRFSRDHKWLAFQMDNSIIVLNTETGNTIPACEKGFSCPAWSPDAKQILVREITEKQGRSTELFVLPASGGAGKKIDIGSLPKGAEIRRVDWSPDGRKIAYTVFKSQLTTLLIKNLIPKNKR